jgi:XTP/dITP diphosphohydrolase
LIRIHILNKLIIASGNSGKISEIKRILALEGVRLVDLKTAGFKGHIEESGSTFTENALIKAEAVYSRFRIPVISDDSGLSVPFLNGKPGVMSARFAGPGAGDKENNNLLLEKLKGVGKRDRKAWFTCTAVFYWGDGGYFLAEGKIKGVITCSPAGSNGFGYDPLFYIPGQGKTMAELSQEEKNRISHRAKAFKRLKSSIEDYYRNLG